MFRRRFLPWEYGVRNLLRRPARTALTLLALTTVILLILVVVGFIRGLEKSLAVSGDPQVVLVYSQAAEENIENSSIPARTPGLVSASVSGVQNRFGIQHVSPELYLGTRVQVDDETHGLGLVRGVTQTAPLVRRQVRIVEGNWPGPGEILVGALVATKLGCDQEQLALGESITIEKQSWIISGRFTAGGSSLESEIWCSLPDFQQALKRQNISLVALLLEPGTSTGEVELFCQSRTDLELQGVGEIHYYQSLQQHYQPVQFLAWMVVLLIAGAGIFSGLNLMYGAVDGRIRELATLQAIGYRRRAILITLIQEGMLLAATSSLLAGGIALTVLNNVAVRFTMGAFALQIDSTALLIGCGVGLSLGVLGALPPAIKALRLPIAQSLKAI